MFHYRYQVMQAGAITSALLYIDFWMRLQANYDLAQESRILADDPILNLGKNPVEDSGM